MFRDYKPGDIVYANGSPLLGWVTVVEACSDGPDNQKVLLGRHHLSDINGDWDYMVHVQCLSYHEPK